MSSDLQKAAGQPEFRSLGRVRSALANAAGYRALSQIAGAVTYVLLVRIMSEYDYGVYNLFYSVPAVMGAVLSLGIGNTLHRFLPEYFAAKNYSLAHHFIRWCLRLRLVSNALFLLLFIIFWDAIAPIFEIEHLRSYFLLFSAIILSHFQCRIITLALSANLLQQWSSGLSTAFAVLKLIGYGVAAVTEVSLSTILIVDLVSYLIWYAGLRFIYHTRIPSGKESGKAKFSKDERKRLFRYAAYYNFNDVGVVVLKSTPDRLIIAAFLNPVAVGAYAFCTGLNAMVQRLTPVTFFNGVIEPLVFTLDYVRQKPRARGYYQFLVKINYLVQFPVLVLFASVTAPVIRVIFDGKFLEYEYLLILAFALPALYRFQAPVMIIAQLGERAGIILASKIFAAYNLAAAFLLIPPFGVYGAMIATCSAQFFKTVFVWYFVRDVATFRGMTAFFLSQTALWGACWFIIRFGAGDFGDLLGIAVAVLVIAVFALLSVRFAHFNKTECDLIRKVSGPRIAGWLEKAGVIR